jgi:NitT/TauT family transport system ATP-binding protein
MCKTPLVSLKQLSKHFGTDKQILDSIDLDIYRGEFIAIIGPSGCGKSTILKLIANLLIPSSGSITVGGGSAELSNEKYGFVFQEANLLPWKTAIENVMLPLQFCKYPAKEQQKIASRLLDLVNLSHAADYYPRQLSGGMKMRVSIARSLATEPELLLLDEPFGALDEMTRDSIHEQLLDIRMLKPWTGIFVTHSITEAVFLSSKILVMSANPGRIEHEIEVDFPYPRTAALRTASDFQQKVIDVTTQLHRLGH